MQKKNEKPEKPKLILCHKVTMRKDIYGKWYGKSCYKPKNHSGGCD